MPDKLTLLSREMLVDYRYAAATGYFLIAFSYLEEELNRAIWAMLGISRDRRSAVITTAVRDFGQRMMLLAKLGKAHLKKDRDRENCANVIKAISFINDRRVELVHSEFAAWDSLSDTAYLIQAKADRTKIKRVPSVYSTDFMCDLTEFTLTAARAVLAFRRNLLDGTDHKLPSVDKRPEQPK